jgi:hypothetical protein
MAQPYLVVRLVPEAPIDGATFSTYLDGLQLQVFNAFDSTVPLSDVVYASPLSLFQWPPGSGNGPLLAGASAVTSAGTNYISSGPHSGAYGDTLSLDSTEGISVGSFVFTYSLDSNSPNYIDASDGITVTEVMEGAITLSQYLGNYVPGGTVVSFIGSFGNALADNPSNGSGLAAQFSLNTTAPAQTVDSVSSLSFANTTGVTVGMLMTGPNIAPGPPATTVAEVTATTVTLSQVLQGSPATGSSFQFTENAPFASLSLKVTSTSANLTQLTFPSASGIAFGMSLNPLSDGSVKPGTTVVDANGTDVTLSQTLNAALPANTAVTFTFPLSFGIVQHLIEIHFGFGGLSEVAIPTAVATAVIPLNLPSPAPEYLNVKVTATRNNEVIPVNEVFYNVLTQTDSLPDPTVYQLIPANETSFYVTLPPQPGPSTIPLTIPNDGSAPEFDPLYDAIVIALTNDPIFGPVAPGANVAPLVAQLISSTANCSRVAYDIVWSYLNPLPTPPDPLEVLYTSEWNPGNSSPYSTDNGGSGQTLEQDRQKFEGTLKSFYSTRNATAERLAKFVAAASAAVFCEQTSLYSTSALLEFPVDPYLPFASSVESEILLQGLGGSRSDRIHFGVPAAFFYALGAKMDKSTSAF